MDFSNLRNSWTAEDALFTRPGYINSGAGDGVFWRDWGMVAEFERRYSLLARPGTIRFLGYLNAERMGSYDVALSTPGTDITRNRAYRQNFGFGLNWEEEITENTGVFSRLGWNQGRNEAWNFTDVNYMASVGISVKCGAWGRADDTVGLAGVTSGITRANQKFLEAGGTGILDGDGALDYGWEKVVETYYDCRIWNNLHLAADYQFVSNPAFNRDRGPVSVLGARLHIEL